MSKPDGGQAFPMHERDDGLCGMSLRDYFAAKALAGMLAAYSGPDCTFPEQHMAARRAYEYADAMLKAREAE